MKVAGLREVGRLLREPVAALAGGAAPTRRPSTHALRPPVRPVLAPLETHRKRADELAGQIRRSTLEAEPVGGLVAVSIAKHSRSRQYYIMEYDIQEARHLLALAFGDLEIVDD